MENVVFLIVITDFHIRAETERAAVSGNQVIQYFQKCGFAGAVVSDNGNMFSALDCR